MPAMVGDVLGLMGIWMPSGFGVSVIVPPVTPPSSGKRWRADTIVRRRTTWEAEGALRIPVIMRGDASLAMAMAGELQLPAVVVTGTASLAMAAETAPVVIGVAMRGAARHRRRKEEEEAMIK